VKEERQMSQPKSNGYFRNGMPYNRRGHGPRPLVVFQGLMLDNKPQAAWEFGLATAMYKFLDDDYTVYSVLRKPGMPQGYTLQDMAADYAVMIREEFGGPLDVIGISTGGSIVQHFAADHPELVRRLVIHSCAYVLSDHAKQLQLALAEWAQRRQWFKVWNFLMTSVMPQHGIKRILSRPVVWLFAALMALTAPQDPNDVVVTIEAEDRHNFKDRLPEITAPTLIAGGEQDPYYTPTLFRETAAGIPNARLRLYPNMGHPTGGKQFQQDVLAFLRENN
jgi:pimeloyl-ACP methyl ester carboxylesterase